jgi:catechol 2,3-dioxygenase-like lactoylglutathione lyase family enzyme
MPTRRRCRRTLLSHSRHPRIRIRQEIVAMIDHTGVTASNFAASKAFYAQALAPLGYGVVMEIGPAQGAPHGAGFGEPGKPDFWLAEGAPNKPPVHVAFRARTRTQVDAFYQAAMAAGGRDNGPPGLRPHYHPDYYGAFVLDPDGHNIEAVCHAPA